MLRHLDGPPVAERLALVAGLAALLDLQVDYLGPSSTGFWPTFGSSFFAMLSSLRGDAEDAGHGGGVRDHDIAAQLGPQL